MLHVTEMGWKAATALARSGGSARVQAQLARSTYLVAGGEIVWLGQPGTVFHGRAILAADTLGVLGDEDRPERVVDENVILDTRGALVWRPTVTDPPSTAVLRKNARAFAGSLTCMHGEPGRDAVAPSGSSGRQLASPEGFASRLVGAPVPAPLERANAKIDALACACDADDAVLAAEIAASLLGLGPGLTPSGDDLVGGLFFARRLLTGGSRDGSATALAWNHAAALTARRAGQATHPISAVLLGDLIAGDGWAPLHDLSTALTLEAPPAEAVNDAARRLVAIGHTSGWDMLAGFLIGLLGSAALNVPSRHGGFGGSGVRSVREYSEDTSSCDLGGR
jgi:uncharacterized protein DUF2877